MPKLIILGSANAISDQDHENTHMVVVGEKRLVLIDCVSSPITRLEQVGVHAIELTDLILTHFHPDHVLGVPLLLMNLWLMGRHEPLTIHGLQHTLDRTETVMGAYGWSEWPNFFPVTFHRLPTQEMVPVLEDEEIGIFASPVQHFIPTIGVKIVGTVSRKTLVYSCDTEPCPAVDRLAAGADVLIHEATGASPGHSSAAQAGEAAFKARAGALLLIHYPIGVYANGDLIAEAREKYAGPVSLAKDLMKIDL